MQGTLTWRCLFTVQFPKTPKKPWEVWTSIFYLPWANYNTWKRRRCFSGNCSMGWLEEDVFPSKKKVVQFLGEYPPCFFRKNHLHRGPFSSQLCFGSPRLVAVAGAPGAPQCLGSWTPPPAILYVFPRWWQLKRFFKHFLPRNLGEDHPIWRAYFSDGLVQPPTRMCFHFWYQFVKFLGGT